MALFDGCTSAFKLSDLSDATGTVSNLTNNNSVSFVTGKIGNAGQFVAASSKFLSHTSVSALEMADSNWTVGCWVNLDTKAADMMIVAKHDDTFGLDYRLQYSTAFDCFQFITARSAAAVTVNVGDSVAVNTGTWYCVVAWHDSAVDKIYISKNDGTVYETPTGGALDASLTGVHFRIGARGYTSFENYFDGKIDAVHLWKGKILSAGERTEFYNSGNGVEFTAGAPPAQMPYYGGGYSPYRRIIKVTSY